MSNAKQTTKPWYYSKTIIFNIVAAMFIAAEASLGSLASVFSTEVYGFLALALAVINAALRVISSTKVTK